MKLTIKTTQLALSLLIICSTATHNATAMDSSINYNDPTTHNIFSFLPATDTLTQVNKHFQEAYYNTPRQFHCQEFNTAALRKLEKANIQSLKIYGFAPGIEILPTMRKVHNKTELLDLTGSNISTDQMSVFIKHFPNLETLAIAGCHNAPAGLVAALETNHHAILQNLKKINLADSDITTDQMHIIIQDAPNLETLNISGCHDAPAGLITALEENPAALQQLKTLILQSSGTTAAQLFTIIQRCTNLETLDLAGCFNVQAGLAAALEANATALQYLKSINLSHTAIAADQVASLIQRCQNLKKLTIANCYNAVTNLEAALTASHTALQRLKDINLTGIRFTVDQLSALLQRCSHLKELTLKNCSNAPKNLVTVLTANPNTLQNLKKINLSNTFSTEAQRTFIRNMFPHALIIF